MTKNKVLGVLAALLLSASTAYGADFRQTETSTFPAVRPVSSMDERMPNIGLLIGSSTPEGSFESSGEIGIDLVFQPYIPFGIGLEAMYSEPESELTGEKLKRTSVLAKVLYNFGGSIPIIRDSYIGAGAGAVFVEDESESQFASAPMVGFDIPLRNALDQASVSLGANAKYLFVDGDDPDALSVNGVVRYWY
ncbi:MAG: hypothetical protein A2622_11535 [Bdellovibrionales bacterium RIFCSPHIGHO2_01_FULL_40_29]|nr:MAG: hypothetical protein A2622_11535 [Bdellovibrionales bacterium RIFCSPHIGHO2_01_FULL_40_29]OFZ34578.1 MAG: hypothetical protein A3D17_01800 [Bdellovibrionales bacterium RIFCSPHIGHO2_02_FULL_40_15]